MQKALSYVRRAVDDYAMINAGDHVTVGVSGGKDSLTLLVVLAKLREFYPKPFELSAVTLAMGYDDMNFDGVAELCASLGVPYVLKQTDIREILFDIRKETNPCSLCAKMRRGALHEAALELGSHKVALGHHHDDAIETFMLSLLFEGRIHCFSPVTYLDRRDITLIRPMLYMPEQFVRTFTAKQQLPVVHNSCPADGNTKRQYVKDLIRTLDCDNPGLKTRLFTAMCGGGVGHFKDC